MRNSGFEREILLFHRPRNPTNGCIMPLKLCTQWHYARIKPTLYQTENTCDLYFSPFFLPMKTAETSINKYFFTARCHKKAIRSFTS